MADASGYFEEVSKLSANIQLIGAAGSAIGGLFILGFSEVVRCLNEISSASFKHGNVQNDLLNLPKLGASMSGFKDAYRIDPTDDTSEITWEEGCPLLLDALQIARNTDTGEAYIQTRSLNISGEKINSFKVAITVVCGDGSEENLCLNPLDADIFSGLTYSAKPVVLSAGDAIEVKVKVESVGQDSGQWASHLPLSKVRKPCALSLSSMALEERVRELRELGCKDPHKAFLYSIERNDGWTLCPCGQVNVGTKHCVSCGLGLSTYSSALEDLKTLSQKGADRKEREAISMQGL